MPSRRRLLAAFDRFTEQAQRSVRDATLTQGSAAERLDLLLEAWLAQTAAQPDLSRLLLDFLAHGTSAGGPASVDFGQVYADYREAVSDVVSEAMREGDLRADLAPDAVAAILVGALEGVVLQWIVDPEAVSLVEAADSLSSVLFAGLRPG